MYLVLIAVVMAIGFSAFTPPVNKKATNVVTYQDDNMDWHVFTGDPCKGGWNEAACNNTPADRRFIHSAGPFPLVAGAPANNITIGAVWDEHTDQYFSL